MNTLIVMVYPGRVFSILLIKDRQMVMADGPCLSIKSNDGLVESAGSRFEVTQIDIGSAIIYCK